MTVSMKTCLVQSSLSPRCRPSPGQGRNLLCFQGQRLEWPKRARPKERSVPSPTALNREQTNNFTVKGDRPSALESPQTACMYTRCMGG